MLRKPQPAITITFACTQRGYAAYQSAAQAFNQANPDVQVRVPTWQQAGIQPFQAGGDTTAYIDAIYWWQQELAHKADAFVYAEVGVEGSSQGLVLDLSPYIETDGGPTDADFAPGLLDRFRWQGGLWGLPAGVNPVVVFYDPAAFEQAGLEPPTAGWTWGDLLKLARELVQQEAGQTTRYGFADPGMTGDRSAVAAWGGRLADTSAQPPAPVLDDPAALAALAWYTNLALVHDVMHNPVRGGNALEGAQTRRLRWVGRNSRPRSTGTACNSAPTCKTQAVLRPVLKA